MRFVVRGAVLDGDDSVITLIDRLVDRLAEGVHKVEVPEADRLKESSWYKQARPTRQKVLTSAVAKPPRRRRERGPHLKTMELLDAASVISADKLAHTPLVVLVEDREADGVFLDLLIEELGWPELRSLWESGRQATPRAMEIDTAGGKDAMPQRVRRIVNDASDEGRPHRLFVLRDSEARWPGDDQERKLLAAVLETCDKYGVPCHVWKKRSIENYIPDEVFEAVRDDPRNQGNTERFDALLRRPRAQRDHFPIKAGLTARERDLAIEAGLYSPSEHEDLALLETPLLPKRPRPLKLLARERRDSFTADGLRTRDGDGELEAVLRSIAQEL